MATRMSLFDQEDNKKYENRDGEKKFFILYGYLICFTATRSKLRTQCLLLEEAHLVWITLEFYEFEVQELKIFILYCILDWIRSSGSVEHSGL